MSNGEEGGGGSAQAIEGGQLAGKSAAAAAWKVARGCLTGLSRCAAKKTVKCDGSRLSGPAAQVL